MCIMQDTFHTSMFFLRNMKNENHPANQDLKSRGFGCSMSGDVFSSIHGDLVTEIFNGVTKRQGGPHRGGYTKEVQAVNTWIKTSHIHAKVRTELKNKIHLKTSSVHKESTTSGKNVFLNHVQSLKAKLLEYEMDPFQNRHARDLMTGKELDNDIIQGLLDAPQTGVQDCFRQFVNNHLLTTNEKVFEGSIKKLFVNAGLKKKKNIPKSYMPHMLYLDVTAHPICHTFMLYLDVTAHPICHTFMLYLDVTAHPTCHTFMLYLDVTAHPICHTFMLYLDVTAHPICHTFMLYLDVTAHPICHTFMLYLDVTAHPICHTFMLYLDVTAHPICHTFMLYLDVTAHPICHTFMLYLDVTAHPICHTFMLYLDVTAHLICHTSCFIWM